MPPAPNAAKSPEHLPVSQRAAIGPAPVPADEPAGPLDGATGARVLDLLPEPALKLGAAHPMPPPSDRPASRRLHLAEARLA
jgi:predicted ABC-type transport system involved in lysophospholipase L1 biosynthesis ATPase subunit